jgi:hypothetical protein
MDIGDGLHWFFKVTLTNGERYAVDLCTSQFASLPGNAAWACVAPLDEHLQRLQVGEKAKLSNQQCITKNLGYLRQVEEETMVQAPTQEIIDGTIRPDDVYCLARKFCLWQLEEVIKHWASSQLTTPSKALRLPAARYAHMFCTIVWPLDLLGKTARIMGNQYIVEIVQHAAAQLTASQSNGS